MKKAEIHFRYLILNYQFKQDIINLSFRQLMRKNRQEPNSNISLIYSIFLRIAYLTSCQSINLTLMTQKLNNLGLE